MGYNGSKGYGVASGGSLVGLTPGVDYCPVDEYESLLEQFAYTAGLGPPDPPYTRRDGSSSRTLAVQAGGLCRFTLSASSVASSAWSAYVKTPNLPDSQCGLFVEATVASGLTAGGSHGAGGICLGLSDNLTEFNWVYYYFGRVNGGSTSSCARITSSAGAASAFSSAGVPSTGQIIRIELLGNKQLVRFLRMQADRTIVSEVLSTISTANAAPGCKAGLFASGTGGSNGGSSGSADLSDFRFGFI